MSALLQPEAFCLSMFVVTCGLLLLGFPVAFTLAGSATFFAFLGYAAGAFDLAFLTAVPQRIFATMSNDVLVAVPLFVFMGVMFERSRIAEELLDNLGRLFSAVPAGLAIAVSVVGALMAASTGIVGATVVTMGLISLPTMIRRGYDVPFACGSITASGTLGQIIPPSIVLVLLGDQLASAYQSAQFSMGIFAPDTVSVNDLFAGALVPGLMLVALYCAYQVAYALIRPAGAPPVPPAELGDRPRAAFLLGLVGSLVAPLLLIVAVLGSILGGLASPSEAAGVGAAGATMLAGYRADPRRGGAVLLAAASLVGLLVLTAMFDLRMQRESFTSAEAVAFGAALVLTAVLAYGIAVSISRNWRQRMPDGVRVLQSVMRSTMEISSMVFVILIGAGVFSLVFRGFHGDLWVEAFLGALPGGTVGALLLVMAVMFVMGFFLDFLEIVFIVVPIVAPILLKMEIAPGVLMSPVWLGVMMAMNLQTSFLTPPFGFALFFLRGVAPGSVSTMQIYRGVVPFVAIQLLMLVILWLLPDAATWLPLAIYGR